MVAPTKRHRIRSVMKQTIAALPVADGRQAAIILLLMLCIGVLIFNAAPSLLLHLLQWLGKGCVWCTIAPA